MSDTQKYENCTYFELEQIISDHNGQMQRLKARHKRGDEDAWDSLQRNPATLAMNEICRRRHQEDVERISGLSNQELDAEIRSQKPDYEEGKSYCEDSRDYEKSKVQKARLEQHAYKIALSEKHRRQKREE